MLIFEYSIIVLAMTIAVVSANNDSAESILSQHWDKLADTINNDLPILKAIHPDIYRQATSAISDSELPQDYKSGAVFSLINVIPHEIMNNIFSRVGVDIQVVVEYHTIDEPTGATEDINSVDDDSSTSDIDDNEVSSTESATDEDESSSTEDSTSTVESSTESATDKDESSSTEDNTSTVESSTESTSIDNEFSYSEQGDFDSIGLENANDDYRDDNNNGLSKTTKIIIGVCVPVGAIIIGFALLLGYRYGKRRNDDNTRQQENQDTGTANAEEEIDSTSTRTDRPPSYRRIIEEVDNEGSEFTSSRIIHTSLDVPIKNG